MKKLVILSGPSGVGKTPLLKSLKKNYPEISFGMPVMYTSRTPRPGEEDGIDFHFRSESEIKNLPAERFITAQVRHLWQAIDLQEAESLLRQYQLIIAEIHPSLAKPLMEHPIIHEGKDFVLRTVFISPLLEEEIKAVRESMGFASPTETVSAIMMPKLLWRSLKQGKMITEQEIEDIRIRVSKAYEEMQIGKKYSHIIINHDSEDSEHWKFSPPIGEAGETLKRFVTILTSE